jgi:hypothetical protein
MKFGIGGRGGGGLQYELLARKNGVYIKVVVIMVATVIKMWILY